MVGDILRAVKLSERLLEQRINALPIVFPAVPMKAARVRFFITAHHTPEDIKHTVERTRQEMSVSTWWKDKMIGVMGAAMSR